MTIQQQLDDHGKVHLERGTYDLAEPLIFDGNKELSADYGTIVRCQNGFVRVSNHWNKISGVRAYDISNGGKLGIAFEGGNTSNNIFRELLIDGFHRAVSDESLTGDISLTYMELVSIRYSPVRLFNVRGMFFWDRCAFVCTGPNGTLSEPFVEIRDNQGMIFSHCHLQGNGDIANPEWAVGVRILNSSGLAFDNCTVENFSGHGFAALNCNSLRFTTCNFGLNTKTGFWVKDCIDVEINGMRVRGRKLVDHIPGTPNIFLSNTHYVMSNLVSIDEVGVSTIEDSIAYPY